jgi:hypothetical protein
MRLEPNWIALLLALLLAVGLLALVIIHSPS